ncbi:sugar phosphate isomerase/epimerase family protein [Sphingomonas jatrophae]|uniref:Hydroxypyruvate isomerase n=1 Tax=Sphingomonas jatrophae TaxID=1166337 RepID=A0A1I6KI70_9SPHN|nr:sugar phosphate isomerase/epimerase family protein [Sphingomonas jatrophae]SFR90935.1 hydroxypyruvate isomerase [Sphingomonas jatrophae]
MRRLRFAAHLGVRAPDRPLFMASAGLSAAEQIAWIAAHGFAGVFDNFLCLRSEAEQAAFGRLATDHGLEIGSFALDPAGWATPLWSRDDAEARAAQDAVVARAVAAARRAGSRTATCVTGFDPARPRAEQRAAMAANLARVGDAAAAGGLTLCVEPVAEAFIPGLLVTRVREAEEIVAAADHPAVRLAFDVGHIAIAGDDPAGPLPEAPGLVQIADAPGRIDPGAGSVDWHGVFTMIERTGFAGLIEVELEAMRPGVEGEAALLARLAALDRMMGEA